MPTDLLHDLTDAQRQAVTHVDGAILVVAGPGSGKTRVITRRVAYLVANGIPAWQILALTFTNKAAGEMRERIARLVGDEPSGMWCGTFHAIGARMLRAHPAGETVVHGVEIALLRGDGHTAIIL